MQQRDIFVRPVIATSKDSPEVQRAMDFLGRIRDMSNFDADVLSYPTTAMMCAYVKSTNEPILYVPVQHVHMFDGLGPNPMASASEVAQALAQIIKHVHYESFKAGIGEIYFPCTDEGVNGLATRHGFTRMQYEAEEQSEGDAPPVKVLRDMPFLKMKVYR